MAKIIGNITATPYPRPDWNQTDETKADYIKNKPDIEAIKSTIFKIITKEEVVAGINTRAYLSIDVSKGGYNSAYMVVEEQDPDTGEWSRAYYHEFYDNYNFPDLDLSNATSLSDEEKNRILTNIGAASFTEVSTLSENYNNLVVEVWQLQESLGDIDTALNTILTSLNTSIGGDV